MTAVAATSGSIVPPERPRATKAETHKVPKKREARRGPRETYLNRELSWLEYSSRVLHEAADPRTPLLDRVRFMTRRANSLPIKYRFMSRQYAERAFTGIRAFPHRAVAIKIRGEKDAFRVGIKQHLLRIKAVQVRRPFTRHRIRVITRFTKFPDGNSAMPDSSRLMKQKIEPVSKQRINQVRRSVKQQRDALGMLGMDGEVERLLSFEPGSAQR